MSRSNSQNGGIAAKSRVSSCWRLLKPTLVAASLVMVQLANSHAEDWPRWRGANHDAISLETGLAESWPEVGPPVLWTREIGKGYSSFIAVGDRVWTQAQTLYEQVVICLDAQTGETIWSRKYGWPYDGGGLYPGPRATPAWHEGFVYFAAPEGTIGCLDATTGRTVWEANPKKSFHGKGTDFGCAASPVVIDGKVIVPVGGTGASVVALDAKDGSVVWKSGDSPASYSTILPIELNGRKRVVGLLENSLALFDLASGRLEWEDEFSTGYDEHSAAPLYREPHLMIAGPFRSGAKCYRLDETIGQGDAVESKIKPATVWEAAKFSNDIASSVLVDGCVYGFDLKDIQSRLNRPSRGEFRCLDFATGKILWSTDRVGHANILVADGKLILFNDKGELILARVNSAKYEELARTQIFHDEICWSTGALSAGRLFLRTQTQAVCLYLGAKPLQAKIEAKVVADIPKATAFNPAPLLGGEREFPATVPEWSELQLWWGWCLVGLVLSSALAALASIAEWLFRRMAGFTRAADANGTGSRLEPTSRPTGFIARGVFWLAVVLYGCVASPVLNRRLSAYVFLWPLVLWVALQFTLIAVRWAESKPTPERNKARWFSRIAGMMLFATGAIYFHLCRRLGLSIEWGFLTGFLPAFPVAALIAPAFSLRHRLAALSDLVFAIVSFSAYYWSCAVFLKWWLQVGS